MKARVVHVRRCDVSVSRGPENGCPFQRCRKSARLAVADASPSTPRRGTIVRLLAGPAPIVLVVVRVPSMVRVAVVERWPVEAIPAEWRRVAQADPHARQHAAASPPHDVTAWGPLGGRKELGGAMRVCARVSVSFVLCQSCTPPTTVGWIG